MITEKLDKALILMKFVHRISGILNKNPDFIQDTKDINYSYFIKVIENDGNEITKFTLGLKQGKMSISPNFKPDVILTLTEESFFGLIRGTTTLEESYFSGNADIFTQDGQWSTHLPNIKNVFDKIQESVRKELGDI